MIKCKNGKYSYVESFASEANWLQDTYIEDTKGCTIVHTEDITLAPKNHPYKERDRSHPLISSLTPSKESGPHYVGLAGLTLEFDSLSGPFFQHCTNHCVVRSTAAGLFMHC
jgi:hypothetical protein